MSAPIKQWVTKPPESEVQLAIQRLADTDDVFHIAVMPDVHLSYGVCVGTVTATRSRLFPAAVGGDIGCGMTAIRFRTKASVLASEQKAAVLLDRLYKTIPFIKRRVNNTCDLPEDVSAAELSALSLEKLANRDGILQLGTLGRGNHFIEFQRDEEGFLWLMVHSGSRAMGPAIRDFHLQFASRSSGLRWLDSQAPEGVRYLSDVQWARRYARVNRRKIVERVVGVVNELFGIDEDSDTLIDCDHNLVQRETHLGQELWIHRKGALQAREGQLGVMPGSMGSLSYHVVGRGEPNALESSSHGAGRAMSRHEARRRVSKKRLFDDTAGVWFDHRRVDHLREEAPAAYKNIDAVMRAQKKLTRIIRRLEPILVYKGG